ncbi:uncharacterized protein LOC141845308 isoform X2 [Curcuma longa]|uniref:uncharacterized protein LOC141845308 isoform X2 n=1 Tax=Curcuma longa TaxID=136217 RepID=UPI003D9EB252
MSSSSHLSACSYGDALYWDARYLADGTASFDWYQRYSALRPFIRKYVPVSARVLVVGCGNALMSEDMVMDGYVSISNIDISSVVIEMMMKKYEHIPQLEYMLMDARDMTFFNDESFDCVIDKVINQNVDHFRDFGFFNVWCGCSTQCLQDARRNQQITYGDPSVRFPHINQPGCNWETTLYIIARPGFKSAGGCSSRKSIMEPIQLTDKGQLPVGFVLEDPDSHYIYVCKKMPGLSESFHTTPE